MTLAELDKELDHWRQVAESALNNTMEVYENPIYKTLCAGKFDGETARKLGEPSRINRLLEQASCLQNFVDQALAVRQSVSLLNRNEKVAEIAALLTTPSITLEEEQTPLAERSLTSGASVTRKCTPKELLDQLTGGFDLAKTLVSEIDAIQTTAFTKLDKTAKELAAFRSQHPSSEECAMAEEKLKGLEALVATDPMGLKKKLEVEILPLLKAASDAVEAEERQRVQLRADLAVAEALAREYQTAHGDAAARTAERKLKLTTRTPAPEALDESEFQKTMSWLSTLQSTAGTAEWKCVNVGLQKWISKVREQIGVEKKTAAANQILLERRLELRGLLGALQAKVAGDGRAEDKEIFEIGEKARKLLYQRPTPMEEAEALVREYQKLS